MIPNRFQLAMIYSDLLTWFLTNLIKFACEFEVASTTRSSIPSNKLVPNFFGNINVAKIINNGWSRCITKPSDDLMIRTFPILKPNGIGRISFFVHLFLNRTVTRDIKPQLAAFEITTHGLRPLGKIISIKNNMNRTRNIIT